MTTLHIPVLEPGCDTLTAALAYAKAGWYVGPCRSCTKNPGSVLDEGWPQQTSRDPAQITAWFAGTAHDVFLHAGRSGAVIFDVDHPERIPADIVTAIADLDPPYQSTREGQDGRGHYVFGQPDGRDLGNSVGSLANGWGEIRGRNGVIVVEPSIHAVEGGRYKWLTTGPVPVLPDYLAEQIGDALDAADAATATEVAAFLAEHRDGTRPELLAVHADVYALKVERGESRHDSMKGHVTGAMKEAAAGLYDATMAADTLESLFLAAVAKPAWGPDQGPARTGPVARKEWAGLLAWAVAQARAADPDATRTRSAEKVPALTVLTDTTADAEEAFWTARPDLTLIHDAARAALCAPWAVFGAVLARLITAVPKFVVLPALRGGQASINLFVALVGLSGGGKNAADSVADDLIDVGHLTVASIGSGEGIAHQYVKRAVKGGALEQFADAVLFHVGEVDHLTALGTRQGATLLPELRKAYMGEQLGFSYVDLTKRLVVAKHNYRLCLILGVQPGRAGPLLDDADGGTPQRFIWLPTTDPGAPDFDTAAPAGRIKWSPRDLAPIRAGRNGRSELDVASAVRDQIRAAGRAQVQGKGVALDGHALLARLKVAAALAILDKRLTLTEDDWALAGVVMGVSDRTRAGVVAGLAAQAKATNRNRGKADADRAVLTADALDGQRVKRVSKGVMRVLAKSATEWTSHRDLSRGLAQRDRDVLPDAVDALVKAGQIDVDASVPGRPSYRSAGAAK